LIPKDNILMVVFVFNGICILMGLAEPGNPYKTIPSFILPFLRGSFKEPIFQIKNCILLVFVFPQKKRKKERSTVSSPAARPHIIIK